MGIETRRYNDLGLVEPVGIVGFPSVGLVSSIAANYCMSQLGMEPVAALEGPCMPPYCLLSNGRAYPPIRFYGKKSTTKTGKDIVVCTTEYAPKPEDCYEVASSVMETLRDLGCSKVICLEGVPRVTDEDVPVVCGSGRLADASGLERMDNGMVKGVPGIMLYQGAALGMDVTTLMCPANPGMPDPGAAVAFVEPLKKMVKGLRISPKGLQAEDAEIRRRIEESVSDDQEQNVLYG